MYYGVQYYPEHWPEERWITDADMMQRAGVNTVRMGEFAWSAYEPVEGTLDFEWMDRALRLLHARGIRTILCTCSRTPPPWVFARYPGVLNVRRDGCTETPGHRYTVGLGHPEFVALSRRIDRAVVEHFAGRPEIAAWQIDNEIGSNNDCYCPACLERFRAFLGRQYGTPDALNRAWGTHFWSFAFNSFDEVPRPHSNPQLGLAWRRFMSETNVEFTRWRSDMIHRLDPGKPVTINMQALRVRHTDCRRMAGTVDVPGLNFYPPRTSAFTLDYHRGRRGAVLVLEQCTRLTHMDIGEGWMRLWAWLAVAHGAKGVSFFRWRPCRWGQEQMADGLLPHGGQENRRYRELARMGAEIRKIEPLLDAASPKAEVAILVGSDSRWALEATVGGVDSGPLDPMAEAERFYDAVRAAGVTVVGLDPREDPVGCRLAIAPRLFLVDEGTAAVLRRFVENGGTLCLTAASGVVDADGKCFDLARPGPLAELAGVEVSDCAFLSARTDREPLALSSESVPGLDGAAAGLLADEIHPTGAEVLASYATGWRRGHPAVTAHRVGNGVAVYLGTGLTPEGYEAFARHLLAQAGIVPTVETPPGVRAYEQQSAGERILFLLNFTAGPCRVAVRGRWRDALTGVRSDGEVEVGSVDIRILQAPVEP